MALKRVGPARRRIQQYNNQQLLKVEDRAAPCVLKATEIDIKAINASVYVKLVRNYGYYLSTLFNGRCTDMQSTINKRYKNIFSAIPFYLDVLCAVLAR